MLFLAEGEKYTQVQKSRSSTAQTQSRESYHAFIEEIFWIVYPLP